MPSLSSDGPAAGGPAQRVPLRLLLVEDDPDDAALLVRELRRSGYDPACERVDTPEGLRAALDRGGWDLVISDYTMPRFSGADALRIVRESGVDLPFIIVSGNIGEEVAVDAMREGADDYLIKGRLARLAPAVERQLQEAALRNAYRLAETAVDRRDAILKAVLDAAERLLRTPDWRRTIQDVLADIGGAVEAASVYIYENEPAEDAELLTSLRYEWVAPGQTPRIGDPQLQRFPVAAAGFGRWEETLARGEAIWGHVRDLPAREREFLEAKNVGSLACVPIFVGQSWWGSIGFEDPVRDRDWSAAELDGLKTAADTLGAAIQRRDVEEQVARQLRRLAGLRAINNAMIASLDLGVTLNVFIDQVTTQLGVDAADVLLFRPERGTLEYAAGRGFRTDVFQRTSLRLGEGHAGVAALQRTRVSIPNLALDAGSLRRARSLPAEEFAAYHALPLVSKGQVKGVLELFHRAPLDATEEWLDYAYTLAGQAAVALDNAMLVEDLQRSNVELRLAYDTTLEGWSRAMDLRDRETEGHTQRVTDLTLRLARRVGIAEADLVHVRRGALLHDIGKMGVPDPILFKPGPLTEEEWKVMRLHPVHAYELLSPIAFLRPALDVPYCHHEKWDGSGYPRGLKGETIPLAARAFAVVDVWDALRSDRPYRPAWPEERVREHIRSLAGTHFDPAVIDVFLGEVGCPLAV